MSVRSAATARTRAAIIDAAAPLFVERGFGAVSLRDIAARADLSHPGVRRHFASKDEILYAVVDELEQANLEWLREHGAGLEVFAELARHNAGTPGYTALFTSLAGEATSSQHPAHTRFRERHRALRIDSVERLQAAVDDGELPGDTDIVGESSRLPAAWDGLQLISLYLPDRIDVARMLETHLDRLRGLPVDTPDLTLPRPESAPITMTWADALGYAPGRARRARIIADASTLFAARGFHATSLREIADHVGIGKSTLLHYFASKEELLAAVIARRDAALDDRTGHDSESSDPRSLLLELPDAARRDALRRPGLIELYAVLSAEAAARSHPAHDYFAQRFELGIAHFADQFARAAADGHVRPDLDPGFEAIWLVALWDGLQLQWLYDPESTDVGDQLATHIRQLLA